MGQKRTSHCVKRMNGDKEKKFRLNKGRANVRLTGKRHGKQLIEMEGEQFKRDNPPGSKRRGVGRSWGRGGAKYKKFRKKGWGGLRAGRNCHGAWLRRPTRNTLRTRSRSCFVRAGNETERPSSETGGGQEERERMRGGELRMEEKQTYRIRGFNQ